MILSNIEIFRALDERRLIIDPEPSPRYVSIEHPHSPYDTHSVDLMLGNEIVVPKPGQIIEEVKGCPVENPSQFQGQNHPAG